jgi:hypothetical protein
MIVSACSYLWVKIVIKPINNPNGVFSGVTRHTGGQKWSSTPNIVQYVYIPYFNVTSGGKSCTKGTPIIKKVQPFPFYQRRNNERRKRKTKVLTLNKIYPWVPAGLDARSDRAGWLPAVSFYSALHMLSFIREMDVVQGSQKVFPKAVQ